MVLVKRKDIQESDHVTLSSAITKCSVGVYIVIVYRCYIFYNHKLMIEVGKHNKPEAGRTYQRVCQRCPYV